MGILDQISQLRSQGLDDEEVVRRLQEEGITPKAINDALNQARIKKAVVDEDAVDGMPPPLPSGQVAQEQMYAPPQQTPEETYIPSQGQNRQEQYEYSPQSFQGYSDQGTSSGMDTGTMMEIAEQVFSEKSQKIQKQVKDLSDSKALSDSKLDSVSERLKRIESAIDNLQSAILEKVGAYGRGLESIEKEMQMMQDSFGKNISSQSNKGNKSYSDKNPAMENEKTYVPREESEEPMRNSSVQGTNQKKQIGKKPNKF